MKSIARVLVGLSGLLSVLMALGLWFAMAQILPKLGLAPTDLADGFIGRATVRADIAGLFGGMGIAMLIAAATKSRAWTHAALLFVCVAISGRIIGVIIDGAPPAVVPPIAVEAIAIAVLLWFRQSLPKSRA